MKKKFIEKNRLLTCFILVFVMLLNSFPVIQTRAAESLNVNITTIDLRTGTEYTIDGADGKPAIILFGGIPTCTYTRSALLDISRVLSGVDSSALNVYCFDAKWNTAEAVNYFATDLNLNSAMKFSVLGRDLYSFYETCKNCAGVGDSFNLPLIIYKNADGTIFTS